jgi:hypothetical protein
VTLQDDQFPNQPDAGDIVTFTAEVRHSSRSLSLAYQVGPGRVGS